MDVREWCVWAFLLSSRSMLLIAAVGDVEQWLASATHSEPAQKGVATCNRVSDWEEHCAATGA